MAVTTTYAAIRDQQIAKIEALTPALLSQLLFRRAPRRYELAVWAEGAGSAALRKFEIRQASSSPDPNLFDPTALERHEEAVILIAYPVLPALYGTDDLDELEKVMRSDAHQVRDVVFSPGNYLAGQYAAFVEIEEPERGDRVWFQALRCELIYLESQTLI